MRWTLPALGIVSVVVLSGCGGGSGSAVATQVTVGRSHACATFQDGTVRCWGTDRAVLRGSGVLPSDVPREWARSFRQKDDLAKRPSQVINLTGVVETVASEGHTCARRKDGTVWCWGENRGGKLGVRPTQRTDDRPYPVRAEGITGAVQIALGDEYSCARRSDGSVWCWGYSLRDAAAAPVPGVTGATDLKAEGGLTCAMVSGGSVLCWGSGDEGQRGDGSSRDLTVLAKPTLVTRATGDWSVGRREACVLSAGEATCWGSSGKRSLESPHRASLQTVVPGWGYACGLSATGALWCWKSHGAPAERKGASAGAKQLVVGESHECIRLDSGSVQCWGSSWRDTEAEPKTEDLGPRTVDGLGKAVDIAASKDRTCAALEDGTVHCWGKLRKFVTVAGIADATQVSVGDRHACARHARGVVTCWGAGDRGQIGRGLLVDEKPQAPGRVSGLEGVEEVAATANATCARLADGSVRCWGNNTFGELGQGYFSRGGAKSASGTPSVVALPRPATRLQGSGDTFCAKLTDGSTTCWGTSLGLAEPKTPDPKGKGAVLGVTDAVQLAVTSKHACVRTKAGKVLCWGSNEEGQMGDGTWGSGNVRPEPVENPAMAGASEVWVSGGVTCGRMPDTRVVCVGGGSAMRWNVPGVEQATQIAFFREPGSWASTEKTPGCAVMSNGALACWGRMAPDGSDRPVQVRW
jgi:alpha-tubulin suppressor-like RCC1 family protein